MSSSLRKGILQILIVNIFNLVITLITNFILPKHLSIETYAVIKSYQFYINYIGILHLGYADGLYLKYGGKTYQEINIDAFVHEISTFRMFQLAIQILFVIIALISQNTLTFFVALSILPYNMFIGFKTIFQAVGDFDQYSKASNISTIMLFLVNMCAVFVFRTDSSIVYVCSYLICYILIWIILELRIKSLTEIHFKDYFKLDVYNLIDNIRAGILLMLGNFSSIILTGMDRWFIKFLMNTVAFAQYSFAVSIENFINFAVTPISTTLYNYFCRETTAYQINHIRNLVMIFSAFLITAAFPAKFILEVYLTKYIAAADVILYLFIGQFFFIQVKSIHVNLYKAQKRQRSYFIKLSFIVALGAVLNSVLYMLLNSKEAFAIGTMLTAVVWFMWSNFDFPEIKLNIQEYLYISIIPSLFLFCGHIPYAIVGGILYIISAILITYLLEKSEFYYIVSYINTLFHKLLSIQHN